MCGIIGQINFKAAVNPAEFIAMRDTLAHRGPDDAGIFVSENKAVALGHRRLSLLDLSEKGKQPLANENGEIHITVNGEIYNYMQLKTDLENKGHTFSSNSDSEVIVHGYEEWGDEVLLKLKGMFAFALWDDRKKRMLLARDRFGIKPLYYYHSDSTFLFASEIKGIVACRDVPREMDVSCLCDFLVYRYVPSPKSIWKHIKKLPPGHCLTLDMTGKTTLRKYWELHTKNRVVSDKEAVDATNVLIANSVKSHIMGDVPIGSFLSGGYDSSALAYYLHKINYPASTFSLGFDNWDQSEHLFAEMVAKEFGTNHTSKIIGTKSLDLLNRLAFYFDEPIADISIVPTYEISAAAAQKVKAVLSGEGADEIFGGYTWHREFFRNDKNLSVMARIKSRFSTENSDLAVAQYANAMAMGKFDAAVLKDLLHDDLHPAIPADTNWFYKQHYEKAGSALKTCQILDINCFMGELVLTKIDRASMANSLEVRVPFLDHELVEYVMGLHEKTYFKEVVKKFLLYENIKHALPAAILNRPKQGFTGPDEYYQDMNWYKTALLNGRLVADKIIKQKTLENCLSAKDHWRLWKVLVLEFWYSQWSR